MRSHPRLLAAAVRVMLTVEPCKQQQKQHFSHSVVVYYVIFHSVGSPSLTRLVVVFLSLSRTDIFFFFCVFL